MALGAIFYVSGNTKCSRGDHFIVKLNTTCDKNKSTFDIKDHQNRSKFYQFFFMSKYTWHLLHRKKM